MIAAAPWDGCSCGGKCCRWHVSAELRITAIYEEDIVAVCLHFASIETDHSVAVCWEEAE